MIDIENEVFTPIAQSVRESFPGSFVTGEYVKAPSSFPHISIVETDNYATAARMDSSDTERYATIVYEINVYSNKTSGKKTECKAILDLIDKMMFSMNFRRLVKTPVPNMEDATIYRMTARYRAETDGEYIYRV